jgi:hypothetical protein
MRNPPAAAERVFFWAGHMMPEAEAPAEVRGGRAGGSCQPDAAKGTFRNLSEVPFLP